MSGCSICKKEIEENTAPILTVGGYGHPRYLCDECSHEIETATLSREVSEIEAAISSISKKLADCGTEDNLTVDTVADIFEEAGERAKKIKEGTYDFSRDECEELEEEGLIEEYSESEEDAALDERDAERAKKADKIFNIISSIVFGAAIIAFVIIILNR